MVSTAPLAAVRSDGWQPGTRVLIPQPEAYYGYKTNVTDKAGNTSTTLFRSVAVNAQVPFATGLGVPAVLTKTSFNFLATFADSVEVVNQSLQLVFPAAGLTVDSLRYSQQAIGTVFDDVITSPFAGNIAPAAGAPSGLFAHSLEVVNANVFPAGNVDPAAVPAKPTKVTAWSFNPANWFTPSSEIAIPGLNVEANSSIASWNLANPTIAVNHWRIITTVSASNQFGSVVSLRAQVESPTNAPNPPFTRVDFYRLDASGNWYNYLGSVQGSAVELSAACSSAVAEVCGTDQGTYRSWVYQLPGSSYVKSWNGLTQGAAAAGNQIIAIGVVGTGDAISTLATTMIP
jgi:hypothetical protein